METLAATGTDTVERLLETTPAAAFVGKSLILWNGRVGVAYDVESDEWSMLPDNPRAKSAEDPSVLALANGHLLAAYFPNTEYSHLFIDKYLPERKEWKALAEIPRAALEGEHRSSWLSLDGIVQVADGLIVFVGCSLSGTPVKGIRLSESGGWSLISRAKAPEGSWNSSFSYYGQGSVLYGGYNAIDAACGAWDLQDDQWSNRGSMGPFYDFGHCFTGEEVYVFGGAWGSAFARIKEGGWIYSFSKENWRPWPMERGPEGRRGTAVCWTGEQVFVWGGDVRGEANSSSPRTVPRNTGSLFDPASQGWTPVTTKGAPSPRKSSTCEWTGKEVIIWGGWAGGGRLIDAHAYDPEADEWRELPSVRSVANR